MNLLAELYDLLRKENYETYRNNTNVNLTQYQLNNANTNTNMVVYTPQNISDKLISAFGISAFTNDSDIVLIRRVIRMYMLLAQCRIVNSMMVHYTHDTSTSLTDVQKTSNNKLIRWMNNAYDEFILSNNLMFDDIPENTQESISDIGTALNYQISQYRKNGDTLNQVDVSMKKASQELKKQLKTLEKRKASYITLTRIMKASFVFLGIVIIGVLIANASADPSMKSMISLSSVIIGTLAGVIFYFLSANHVKIETFSGSLFKDVNALTAVSETINKEQREQLYQATVMNAASTYLENSVRISMMLNTYKTYMNFNKSLAKEGDKYNAILQDMDQKIMVVNSKKELVNLENRSAIGIVLFNILLMIIVGSATYLIQIMPSMQLTILIIASIIIILAFITYIIYVKSRVRTKPTSIYWFAPQYTP
jgi:hypothetical protein